MKEAHNSTSLGFDPKGIQFEPTDEVARKQGIGGSEAYFLCPFKTSCTLFSHLISGLFFQILH